jgi:diguanylate cyclase (GGDEF)-like protein
MAGGFERFPVRSLVPVSLFEQPEGSMHAVLPLFRQSEHHGLLIIDALRPYPVSIEQMREVVSNVVTSAIVMGELDRARELLSQDLQRAQSLNQQLATLSERDDLTGLLNRRGFHHHAGKVLQGPDATMLMVCDMDGLKAINDTFGHLAGDDAIVAIADVLRHALRDGDLIARMGGDEFAVLCRHLTDDDMDTVRGRIEAQIQRFNANANTGWSLGLSVGFVPVTVGHATQLDQVLAMADARLYEDKRSGRSRDEAGSATGIRAVLRGRRAR